MKNLLKISLGCLFIALALNAAFTYAQGLAPRIPFPDLAWLQLRTRNPGDETGETKPRNVIIYSAAEPVVTEYAPRHWKIEFINN